MAKRNQQTPTEPAPQPEANGAPATPADVVVPVLELNSAVGEIPLPPDPAPPESPESGLESPQGDEPAPRRRRGRKRTGKPAEAATDPQAAAPSPEEIAMLSRAFAKTFAGAARVAARKRGPHWELGADEATAMGDAWSEALAPYLGALSKHAPILAAVMVTYQVIDARLEIDGRRQALAASGVGTLQ